MKILLSTTLLTGNGGNDFFGGGFGLGAFRGVANQGAIEYRETGTAVELDSLYYQFPLFDGMKVTVGPQVYPQ
ncbi:MAG: hypothetical protein HC810_03945 [Acaryochloridaceae cyanobacterium RL_2_7]|nr:hypothetical protein [Acaryochloridaceae cyanobacterium RL_2_7]